MASWRQFSFAALALLLLPAVGTPQTGGQADIAVQGYYLSGQQQRLSDTSGLSVHFQEFLPKFGMLSGVIEDYGSQGRWRQGDNALELRGFPWFGYRWTISGGDFRISPLLVTNPFTNVYYPDLNLRGVEVESVRGNTAFTAYYGAQTLYQGPRIPFRMGTGESAMGGSIRYRLGEHLQLGLRLMRLTAEPDPTNTFLFPVNRRFGSVNDAALQAVYRPVAGLSIFGEASASGATASPGYAVSHDNAVSFFTGVAYESQRLTVRANYADQGIFYLPIAGYFVGDRRGPFAEIRVRPVNSVELFGSYTDYQSNRDHNSNEATYVSTSKSVGFSSQLPGRFTLTGQVTSLAFETREGDSPARSDNRQWTATLNRPVGRHNLRFTYRDLNFDSSAQTTRQVSREFEDTLQFHKLVVGSAVRLDSTLGSGARNTVFTRSNVQLRLPRLTAYSYIDIGRDIVNRSVFSTSAMNSTIFGASMELPGTWTLQAEAYRSTLAMTLNPGNVFLLQSQGVAVPPTIEGLDQWSLFVRANKQIHWGTPLPAQALDRYTAERIPITGTVEGHVYETTRGGRHPVAGITVSVDNSRTVLSNSSGTYRLEGIPEGQHGVGLDLLELPANFEPGPDPKRIVSVTTRRITWLEFEVIRLSQACGKILDAPDPLALGTVVIRLRPSATYTTPVADGSFCFYNLRPGTYHVELDPATLPPLTKLPGSNTVTIQVDPDRPPDAIEFRLRRVFESKPVRRTVLGEQIDSHAPPQPSFQSTGVSRK